MGAMSTLLGRPDAGVSNLTMLLRDFITPNTMYTEGKKGSPVSETPMVAMAALQEVLLMHDSGTKGKRLLHIFPGLGASVPEASFSGLRAAGGLRVSARREFGMTAFVKLESAAANGGASREVVVATGFFAEGVAPQPGGGGIQMETSPDVAVMV